MSFHKYAAIPFTDPPGYVYLKSAIKLKNKTKLYGKNILYNGLKKYAYIFFI